MPLLERANDHYRVAEYLTELPPRDLLARKLHEAIRAARGRLALCSAGNHAEAE